MRWSDDKTGYTEVSNTVFDVIFGLVSPPAQSVYFTIYRQTIGWDEDFDQMTYEDFRKMTGIKDDKTVRAAIEELKDLDLIVVKEELYNKRSYGINKETLASYDTMEDEAVE